MSDGESPLSTAEIAERLRVAWGGEVHETWPEYVRHHSGGDPLYVRELVRLLGSGAQGSGAQGAGAQGSGAQGSGARGSGAQGALAGALGRPAGETMIPSDVHTLIRLRFATLSAACRWLLGGCSVDSGAASGYRVDVARITAAAVDPARVPEQLAEAVAAGILVEDPTEPGRLRFSHETVREARYRSLSRIERSDWERRFAAVSHGGAGSVDHLM